MNPPSQVFGGQKLGLVEAVDRLLDKGVVVMGDAIVSLADVDLVYLKLSLMLSSVDRLKRDCGPDSSGLGGIPGPSGNRPQARSSDVPPFPKKGTSGPNPESFRGRGRPEGSTLLASVPTGTETAPGEAGDLAQLVLTLVEMLRRVLERQALHRMESGGLSEDETERMGLALMELEAKVDELCGAFGLTRGDLDIDLGPLGKIT